MDKSCSSLRDSLLVSFANALEVTTVDTGCIITLPLKTADDRYVDVFIEPVPNSAFIYVHDGGKNTAELFAQGIHPTETQELLFKGIARRHGAIFQKGRFQIACPDEGAVHDAIFRIAQCAALAMIDVVSHEPRVEDEPLSARVGRSLAQWRPQYIEVHRRVRVVGKMGVDHVFDFVTTPSVRGVKPVALKLLPLSVGAHWQAERYGFMVYDIEGQEASRWPRLAVVSKVEEWSRSALDLVRSISKDTILLETDHEDRIADILPSKMTELSDAA